MKRFLVVVVMTVLAGLIAVPAFAVVDVTQDISMTAGVSTVYTMTVAPTTLDFGTNEPGTQGQTIGYRTAIATVTCNASSYMLRVVWSGLLNDGASHTIGYDVRKPIGGAGNITPDANILWASGTTITGTCTGSPVATGVGVGLTGIPDEAPPGVYTGSLALFLEH